MDSVGRHKVALPFVGLGDNSAVAPSDGGDSGELTLPKSLKIYTAKDLALYQLTPMQGEDLVYATIVDPEVSENITASFSAGDNCGRSDDNKYRILHNDARNIFLTITNSYDGEIYDYSGNGFFAVVLDVTPPNS